MTNIISKGIFDMYKAREKLESSRLKDKKTRHPDPGQRIISQERS